jgi:hypothetical protein
MMLSSGSATAAAEASNIISDLRAMKAASLMLYADSMDDYNKASPIAFLTTYLKPYVDNPEKYKNGGNYTVGTNNGKWWVGFKLVGKTPEVKAKLKGKASSIGLYRGPGSLASANAFSVAATSVWMVAR